MDPLNNSSVNDFDIDSRLSESPRLEDSNSLSSRIFSDSPRKSPRKNKSPRIQITNSNFKSSPRGRSTSDSAESPSRSSPRAAFKNLISPSSHSLSRSQEKEMGFFGIFQDPSSLVEEGNGYEETISLSKSLSTPERSLSPKLGHRELREKGSEDTHLNLSRVIKESELGFLHISPKKDRKFNEFPSREAGKKEIKQFEASLVDFLDSQWKRYLGADLTVKKIRGAIYNICRQEVEFFFNVNTTKDITKLYIIVSKNIDRIIDKIQDSDYILQEIYRRYNFIYKSITHWQKACRMGTFWSTSLCKCLQTLISIDSLSLSDRKTLAYLNSISDSNKISLFIELLEAYLEENYDERNYHILMRVFGETPKNKQKILEELKSWGSMQPSSKELLDSYIKEACSEVILAGTIPFKEHSFSIKGERLEILRSRIVPYEIFRCIRQNKEVLFDIIRINKKIIHLATDISDNQEEIKAKNSDKKKDFWVKLFENVYKHFKPEEKVTDKETLEQDIFSQVALFKTCKNASDIPDAEAKIPCLKVLKLMTNSCWGVGYTFFDECFPDIKKTPYWLKFKPGIDCDIRITNNQVYQVTQIKKAMLYPLLNPSDSRSYVPDIECPLARMRISWTVKVDNQQYLGKIKIIQSDFAFLDGISEKHKINIQKRLATFHPWQIGGKLKNEENNDK